MRPKILFILHWPPPVHGSSVVGLQIKQSKIINSDFDCDYINLNTSDTIDEIGKNAVVKVFRFSVILWKTFCSLLIHRPNLCYIAITVVGKGFYKDVLVVLLAKMFRVRLIFHLHNKGISTRQDKFIDDIFYRFVFKKSNVILLSNYLYQDVKKYVTETKTHICPNGIPHINRTSSSEIKKQNEITKILFLSNLIESKGVYVLMDACSMLKQTHVPFQCIFVGNVGDITVELFEKELQNRGLQSKVKYIGAKYGEEKNEMLRNADIFVLPTYNECFPLVLLEALQFGLPIISTYEGGIKDIVENGKTGFLVNQKDAGQLAEKLEILIKNSDLRINMGKAGRIKFEQEFTVEKFEQRLTEIIKRISSDRILN